MRLLAIVAACLLLLAGCSHGGSETVPEAETVPGTLSGPETAIAESPAPESVPGTVSAAPAKVDRSCKVDADCAVKDVGNCCGYYPACVNKASPTFPEQVKQQCEASGTMSICGFKDIQACQCVQGQCAAQDNGAEAAVQ